MRIKYLPIILTAFVLVSCDDGKPAGSVEKISFAIIADPHIYDLTLGADSSALDEVSRAGIKMFEYSEALLGKACEEIIAAAPEFVLVCGDITKDGGLANHDKAREYFRIIEDAGIEVYVIPGNHDIGGTRAYQYPEGSAPVPIEVMTSEGFKEFYSDFGYGEAIWQDAHSLSYAVEAGRDLVVVGIDACKPGDNSGEYAWVSGEVKQETLTAVTEKINEYKTGGKDVIAFLHHGLIEHFALQSFAFPEYVIKNSEDVTRALTEAGVSFVFSGHWHSNDIARSISDGKEIYDVQTTSLVSWNSAWRLSEYDPDNKSISFSVHPVTDIDYDIPGGDFVSYSDEFCRSSLETALYAMLYRFSSISEEDADYFMPLAVETFMAQRQGDEPTLKTPEITAMLDEFSDFCDEKGEVEFLALKAMVLDIWNDKTPDNNTSIFPNSD